MSGRKNYYVTAGQVAREINRSRQRYKDELRREMSGLNRDMNQKIKEERNRAQKTEKRLQKQYDNLRSDFKEAEKRHLRDVNELSGRIETTRSELKQYIDTSVDDIRNEISFKIENEKKSAEDVLAALEYSFSEMNRLQCQHYMPDKFDNYSVAINQVKDNMSKENYQAAIATAQQYYIESFTIRQNLEVLNNEALNQKIYIEEKLEKLEELISAIKDEHNKETIEYHTTNNTKEEIEVDIAYWAEDSWNRLLSDQQELRQKYDDTKNITGSNYLPALKAINERSEQLISDFFDLKAEALSNHFASVATMDRQEEIANSLESMGFLVTDNFFENEDERKSNLLLLENSSGEKIMIKVSPKADEQEIKVSFDSLDNIIHGNRMQALNSIIGVEPMEEEGFEHKAAPQEDFDVRRYGRKQKKQ